MYLHLIYIIFINKLPIILIELMYSNPTFDIVMINNCLYFIKCVEQWFPTYGS